jgi:hypothetical protein
MPAIHSEGVRLVPLHHTDRIVESQLSLVETSWTREAVPRWPATLAAQARALQACQRVRGLATPPDLLRALLATATPETVVVSRWLLSGLGLDTLRQQVQGTWSEARLQACLPRLRRFLCHRLRRRVHQESAVRAWLTQRASLHGGRHSHRWREG